MLGKDYFLPDCLHRGAFGHFRINRGCQFEGFGNLGPGFLGLKLAQGYELGSGFGLFLPGNVDPADVFFEFDFHRF